MKIQDSSKEVTINKETTTVNIKNEDIQIVKPKINKGGIGERVSDKELESIAEGFMTQKEKARWKKLSDSQRQKYVRKAKTKTVRRNKVKSAFTNKATAQKFSRRNSSIGLTKKSSEVINKSASVAGASTGVGVVKEVAQEVGKKTAKIFNDNDTKRHLSTARGKELAKETIINETKDTKSISEKVVAVIASLGGTIMTAVTAILPILLPFIIIMAIIINVLLMLFGGAIEDEKNTYDGSRIVSVALKEKGTTSGEKYWKFTMGSSFVNDSATPWCACFVSWCANECGYIESGLFPKSAGVAGYKSFFGAKGLYKEAGSYTPKTGDLICFGSNAHIGIVQYVEGNRVITIEGNTGGGVYERSYALSDSYVTGYCTPEYPENIDIPEPYGTEYSYMGWQTITSPSSKQYQLRQEAGMNFDANGFGVIKGRYVVACTTTYGQVGDYIDWTLENGTVIKAVIGDIKNQNDAGCNEWGHKNGACVIEFVVDKASWYGTSKYPTNFHPEWNSRVVNAHKVGSFW
ncbi:hypothetical protein M2150_001669 [Lachnospiraceae bacterium PM6-15]|uniref:CHAP domain-containing protein n=1 Tax=Ohessyouella blattaphilus TaxID=2949333 RepID=UPI003E31B4E6